MRKTHKLLFFALMALAAMAFAAPSASALEVESDLSEEGLPHEHCGPVIAVGHDTAGGCEIHVVNSTAHTQLLQHIPGVGEVVAEQCDTEFELFIDEDGRGFVNHFRAFNSSGGESAACGVTVTACDIEADGTHEPWPISINAGATEAVVRVCLDILRSATGSCEIEGDVHLPLNVSGGEIGGATTEGTDGSPLSNRVIVSHGTATDCATAGAISEIRGGFDFEPHGLEVDL